MGEARADVTQNKKNPNQGRDAMAKRYLEHGDPRTGERVDSSEKAERMARDVAERVDRHDREQRDRGR